MQHLEVFQSLWAMEQRIPGRDERSADDNLRLIANAGYHGVSVDPSVAEIDATRAMMPLLRDYGLKCMVNAFPYTIDEMAPILDLAVEMDAVMVNSIGAVMPLTVAEGADVVRRWMGEAAERDMPLLFETHRDCTLNDLYYTIQLMEAVPDMRLCADLSHYVIDRKCACRSASATPISCSACWRAPMASRGAWPTASRSRSRSAFPSTRNGCNSSAPGGKMGSAPGANAVATMTRWFSCANSARHPTP